MLKKLAAFMLTCSMVFGTFGGINVFSAEPSAENSVEVSKVIAFPGAEGGGMYSLGARGALEDGQKMEVYHVTNLNDSGEGSFRDAVSKGNRIVVFDVSGYIDLERNVNVDKGNMTILGQTAPGDGICFRGNNVKITGKNVIVRYLRFRVGDKDKNGNDTIAQDGLAVSDNSENVIIDHCSVSWGTDENLASYAVKDVTIQWSIVSEALNQSVHDKGEHSYAAIWGGVNLSVHHNIIATHKSRNPKIGTSETVAMTNGYTDDKTLVDIRNNIFYNWGDKAGYGAENGAEVNIINNWYKPGPATPAGKRARIFEYSGGNKYQPSWSGKVFAEGNHIDVDANDPDKATADIVNKNNYQPELKTGVYPESSSLTYINLTEPNLTYFNEYPINTQTAQEAYSDVLADAGARLPKLDIVDQRIISNVTNRTAPTGAKGSVGLLDSPMDGVSEDEKANYDDRGYPKWTSETRTADFDSDGDGIADTWEDKMGLDKKNKNDSLNIGPNGYTWLEIYVEEELTKSSKDSAELPSITLDVSEDYETITYNCDKAVSEIEVYCNDKLVKKLGSANAGEGSAKLSDLPWGENYITLKAYNSKGEYSFSNTKVVYILGEGEAIEDWIAEGNAVFDGNSFTLAAFGEDSKVALSKGELDTDFDFVAEIEKISNLMNNAETGVIILGSNGKTVDLFKVYKDYKQIIQIRDGENSPVNVDSIPLADDYNMLKISRANGKIGFYAAISPSNWILVQEFDASLFGDKVAVKAYVNAGGNKKTISGFSSIKVVVAENKTTPKVQVLNVSENQQIGFNENLMLKVTPEKGEKIVEICVYHGNNLINDVKYRNGIPLEQTEVAIPLNFPSVAAGDLRVLCFDGNLGMGEAVVNNVTVSADITPWIIGNVGGSENDMKTYVQATTDFTYKIYALDGNISGTKDKYGYMYQKFNDDMRMYYRTRPQSAKNFGVMLKNDLSDDGVSYYFGIEPSETMTRGYMYVLKARETKGGEWVVKQAFDSMTLDKYFIIAEKEGNKFNIYTTEGSGANLYKTKTLLTSIDTLIGDEYYMGYAATDGVPDAGWLALENFDAENGDSYKWNMNYGLDWYWQMQEANILAPKWTTEKIAENDTGKMLIQPNENYTSPRYVFREYTINEGVIESGFDVLMAGEKTAADFYLQTNSGNKAFKIGFTDDGKITANDEAFADLTYSGSKWYKIKIMTKIGDDTAVVRVYDNEGNIIGENGNVKTAQLRSVNNVETKQPIPQAFYIEPAKGMQGSLYIDNMYVVRNDKIILELAMSKAKALKESDYSAKTWMVLEAALEDAEKVLANSAATEAEAIEAAEKLNSAIEQLELMHGESMTEKFWRFDDKLFTDNASDIGKTQTIDGLTLTGFSKLETNNKTFEGVPKFTYRLKPDGSGSDSNKCFKFDVAGRTKVWVYAVTTNSTTDKKVCMNYGANSADTLQTKECKAGDTKVIEFEYTEDTPTTITIYSPDGVNYYGIKCETYSVSDKRTKISAYDKTTGEAVIFNGTKNLKSAVIGVVSYDADGKVIDVKKQNITITAGLEETQNVNVGVPENGAAAKVFMWDSFISMKPLCEAYEVK